MNADMEMIGSLTVTCLLAVTSVALWTLRVAVTSAGRRGMGAAIAGVEAVVFTVAFSRIVANLDNPLGLVAYAVGVSVGTMLGLLADDRFSTGQSWVRVIVQGDGHRVAGALLQRRWPVTSIAGVGPTGPVTELVIGVDEIGRASCRERV